MPLPLVLFGLFVVLPVVELVVVVQVAQAFQLGPTLIALLAISFAGAWLVRREGAAAWGRLQRALAQGRMPAVEVVDGALVLVGGTLLLTPGFVTDALGLSLLFPPTRALANRLVRVRVRSLVRVVDVTGPAAGAWPPRRTARDGDVVDVEAIDVESDRDRT